MTTAEDFILKFHHLEGVALKEKKKCLHTLLVTNKNVAPDTLDSIVKNLAPSTYLEETFKIDILIYFKRTNDLLNVLTTGNEIGVSKIVREKWFIKELMEKSTPVKLVEELFPQLSLSIRSKILKRVLVYIKDEKKIEELVEVLSKSYGWSIASVLLPGCSNEKIKEILKNNPSKLSASKVKLLFNKDPSLITFYFELLKNDEESIDDYKWRSLFDYMAIKDPIFFSELSKKFDIYQRQLGRQTTKKFVEAKKDEVLEKPTKFSHLRKDALVRKLGKDFPTFYKNGLPKNVSDFNYCAVKSLMKYYTKSKQYDLYLKSFEETYKKSLWDNTDCMDERLIELVPDKEEREKWIKKFDNRVNYLKYQPRCMMSMECSARMDFVEESDDMAFGETAITERKTIFNTLISTCKLNQDYEALLNILDSFCQRHRNSDVTILYNFLRSIYKELDMEKLTEKHWSYIYEIIKIQLFKKQQLFHPILVEYIKFLYLQKKPIEEQVLILLKEIPQTLVTFEYKNEEFERAMIELYIKLLPQVEDKKNSLAVQITLSVMNWNVKHQNNKICIHDNQTILSAYKKLKDTEKVEAPMMKAFRYLVCRQKESGEKSELDEIYWGNFKILNNKTITNYFLKYKPEVLKTNLDKIGVMLKDKNVNLVRRLKKYDHIEIPSDITKLCLKELEEAEPSKRERDIKILILFMASQEFLNYFKQHIPKVDKVDVGGGDEDTRKMYEIQCALAKHLKSMVNVKDALAHLLQYCRGDVLGSALPSLYSSFCRIPENQLYSALDELSTKAVSVRKHSIFLSSLILPADKVLLKYKQIQTSEKNASVKQHMFVSCYKYFVRNDLPGCWGILEEYMKQIKKEQTDVLKLLANVHCIPRDYRGVFTERTWEVLDKLKKDEVKMDDNMDKLLRNLNKSDVMIMRKEFCMNIIENKLFNLDDCSMSDSVFDFTKNFLMYGDNASEKVEFIFKCLRNFKEKYWNDDEKKIEALKIVNKFCFDIFQDILRGDAEKYDINFPKLFSTAWKIDFTLDETFEEHLLIDFVVLKLESGSNSESISKEMSNSFDNALKKYGSLIINNFKNFMSSSLGLILKGDDYDLNVFKFLDSFLETNSSPEHCALVVDLLPCGHFTDEAQVAYKKMLEKLLQKDQIVRIRLYGKLKKSSYGYY